MTEKVEISTTRNRHIVREETAIIMMITKNQVRETENIEIEEKVEEVNTMIETETEVGGERMTITEEEIHQTQGILVHPIIEVEIEDLEGKETEEVLIMVHQATGQDLEAIDEKKEVFDLNVTVLDLLMSMIILVHYSAHRYLLCICERVNYAL